MDEKTAINQDWQNIKQVILEAATEFKSPKDVKNANHWWDDECKRAIQEKNEARGKCLIRKTKQTWNHTTKQERKLIESAEERKKNGWKRKSNN